MTHRPGRRFLYQATCSYCRQRIGDREARNTVYFCEEDPTSAWCAMCFVGTPCFRDEHEDGCRRVVRCEPMPEPPKTRPRRRQHWRGGRNFHPGA